MGDREFIGDAWTAYSSARKILFVLRLRENRHVVREGYATWTIAAIVRHLGKGQTMILKGWCRLGQGADDRSPPVRLAVLRLHTGALDSARARPYHDFRGRRRQPGVVRVLKRGRAVHVEALAPQNGCKQCR